MWGLCAILIAVTANTAVRTLGDGVYAGTLRFIPLPITHLPEFVTGMTLGNLFLETNEQRPLSDRGFATWAGLGITFTTLCMPRGPWSSAVLIGYTLLLFGLAAESTLLARALSGRVLLVGGAISYSMYLLQTPMRIWSKRIVIAIHHDNSATNFLVSYGLILAVSTATFYWLEEPSRKFLRGTFARWGERTHAVS